MKKKNVLSMMLAGCLALSLTACGGSSESSDASDNSTASGDSGTITLGMIGPLTGSVAVYGTHIENGVKLAIEEINAAGGVTLSDGAHQLAVEVKDDQGDSTECVNAMNALISDGIQLVVGSATSGCTSAITSIANSEGVVMITPSGTADSLTTTMDYVFRTCFRDSTPWTRATPRWAWSTAPPIPTPPACGTPSSRPARIRAWMWWPRNLWLP